MVDFKSPNSNTTAGKQHDESSSAMEIDGSEQDRILFKSQYLTREDVIKRRLRNFKQLDRCYRDHYWALMEDLKAQYRKYVWIHGRSPYREDEERDDASAAAAVASGGGIAENHHHHHHHPISEFLTSSGTSAGERKLMPTIKEEMDRRQLLYSLLIPVMNLYIPGLDKGKGLYFLFVKSETKTPSGSGLDRSEQFKTRSI